MVVSREPHINLADIDPVIDEHGQMLKLCNARIITPKGYEPKEIWALWTDSTDLFTRKWYRTRGYLTRRRAYLGYDKEEEHVTKYFTYAESPDCSRAAYITECPDFLDNRNVIQIVDTLRDKAIKSIVISDKRFHGPLHISGPFYKLKFSRDNRKLMYFARPTQEQKIAHNQKIRDFIMGIYDFRTNKISLVTDETLTTDYFDGFVEWTPDGKGIIYVAARRITWHRLAEGYFNTILTDAHKVEKITFSPDGKTLAVFMGLSAKGDNRCVCLLKWPLVRAATLKHDTISLGDFKIFSIPQRPWANNGKHLIFNVIWDTEVRVAAIEIETLRLFELPLPNPTTVTDVRDDELLLETSSANRATRLWYAKLSEDLFEPMEPATCLITEHIYPRQGLDFVVKVHHFEDRAYSAVMVHPHNSIGSGLSLVVMPWWGPEPYYTTHHRIPVVNTLVSFGYCVLVVNYRKPYVEQMRVLEFPTLHGEDHVEDCHNAVLKILEEYGDFIDSGKVFLYGQQFGSFVAFSMIIEHDYFYKRTALVRPMLEYPQFYWALTPALEDRHPIAHADKIYSPVLLIVDEDYKNDKYTDLERAMKRNCVPIVRATQKKWASDAWIYNVIDFYQNLLRRDSSSEDLEYDYHGDIEEAVA